MLPPRIAPITGGSVAGSLLPAYDVGGDWFDHAENPDFACRFRWRQGSMAFWDNRCTQHRVTADYFYELRGFAPHRRRLHRVTIKGDCPR